MTELKVFSTLGYEVCSQRRSASGRGESLVRYPASGKHLRKPCDIMTHFPGKGTFLVHSAMSLDAPSVVAQVKTTKELSGRVLQASEERRRSFLARLPCIAEALLLTGLTHGSHSRAQLDLRKHYASASPVPALAFS